MLSILKPTFTSAFGERMEGAANALSKVGKTRKI